MYVTIVYYKERLKLIKEIKVMREGESNLIESSLKGIMKDFQMYDFLENNVH